MRAATTVALGWLTLLLIGCTSISDEEPPIDMRAPSLELLAQLDPELPLFSIETAPEDFARMTEQSEEEIVIAAEISVRREGALVVAPRPAEMKVKGRFSRRLPQKQLGFKLDDALDNRDGALLRVPALAEGHSLDEIRSFRLRNGGNAFTTSIVKDLAYSRMLAEAGLSVGLMYGEPAAVFVNEIFYGLANVRSEHNRQGLSRLVGASRRDFLVAEIDYAIDGFEVKDGDAERVSALERAARACDLATLRGAVDLASLIDFAAVGSLAGIWDWPNNNVRIYSGGGGPFEFMLYDFDLAADFNSERSAIHPLEADRERFIGGLFFCLYEGDAEFAARFDARYVELLRSGKLSPAVLERKLIELRDRLAPVIAFQTARWGYPTSTAEWQLELETVVRDYEVRYESVRAELLE